MFIFAVTTQKYSLMKKLSLLLLAMIACVFAQAQIATDIYWVQFTDKNDSP